MKKFVAVGLSAMMLAGTFVACGEKEDSTTTAKQNNGSEANGGTVEATDVKLTVWGPQEEQEFLKTQCEAFDEAHAEWEINFRR